LGRNQVFLATCGGENKAAFFPDMGFSSRLALFPYWKHFMHTWRILQKCPTQAAIQAQSGRRFADSKVTDSSINGSWVL